MISGTSRILILLGPVVELHTSFLSFSAHRARESAHVLQASKGRPRWGSLRRSMQTTQRADCTRCTACPPGEIEQQSTCVTPSPKTIASRLKQKPTGSPASHLAPPLQQKDAPHKCQPAQPLLKSHAGSQALASTSECTPVP